MSEQTPAFTSKERTLVERLDRILCDPYVANRAMARTIREARDVLSANPSAPETTVTEEVPWILWFSDIDRELVHFAGHGAESAARRAFQQASDAWTCRLYRCVDQTGYGPKPSAVETEPHCPHGIPVNSPSACPSCHSARSLQASQKAPANECPNCGPNGPLGNL